MLFVFEKQFKKKRLTLVVLTDPKHRTVTIAAARAKPHFDKWNPTMGRDIAIGRLVCRRRGIKGVWRFHDQPVSVTKKENWHAWKKLLIDRFFLDEWTTFLKDPFLLKVAILLNQR